MKPRTEYFPIDHAHLAQRRLTGTAHLHDRMQAETAIAAKTARWKQGITMESDGTISGGDPMLVMIVAAQAKAAAAAADKKIRGL